MKIKTLILGSAAVLVTGGAAIAADLPAAEPVEYVKVCDTFGTGYFYIPGTETCLRIGGNVRYHLRYAEPVLKAARTENHTFTRAEARLQFDARTMTEYGLLRSFIDVRFRATSGTGFTVAAPSRSSTSSRAMPTARSPTPSTPTCRPMSSPTPSPSATVSRRRWRPKTAPSVTPRPPSTARSPA